LRRCRHSPPTFTTLPGCGRWAICCLASTVHVLADVLVLGASRLEKCTPGSDIRAASKQCPALALGHASPDPELDPVVEGVCQTFGTDRTSEADSLGAVLRGPLSEELIWVRAPARRLARPIGNPRH